MGTIIEFKNVSYKYPLTNDFAVKNASFSIEKGKFYGVIGPNGSGKTTLCALIRGFAPNFFKGDIEGEVILDGKSIAEYQNGELALKIGYVFQNPFNQISGVKETVFEEVAFGLENFGVPVEEIEDRVVAIMEETNIMHLSMKNPFDLSGGQQQRVALASILVLEPDILVIDEPTSQLDPEGTESVFKIIEKMKEQNKTIILVEHKVDLMAEFADEIIVINEGQIIAKDVSDKVLSDRTLMDKGVLLPQVSILSHLLKDKGIELSKISTTSNEAIANIKNLLSGGSK